MHMLQPGMLPKSVMELKEPQVRDSSGCRESSESGSIVGDVMWMSKVRYCLGIQACCFWVPLSESSADKIGKGVRTSDWQPTKTDNMSQGSLKFWNFAKTAHAGQEE